mgnify:CR=1 FL=1
MPRTIKKYANRRLYDTEASRHVTLDGIRQLVAGGEDVVVIDDTTGQDITRSILLQVIAEQEQGGRPILSAGMLRHIIRFYGNPMQEFMASLARRGRTETGVVIPTTDAEAFIRGSAQAGVLRIIQ